ncbi:MAG: hypothetical protein M3Y24_08235 [Acidobacteriota bacterium]|nr:hypothetical protein [Acidobacteriota bacterium]
MKILFAILLAAMTLAATPIARVTITSTGQILPSEAKHYAGPYTLHIDGQELPVLCMEADSYGKEWGSHENPLERDLSETYHPDDLIEYKEEAYLYDLLLRPRTHYVDLQFAGWGLIDSDYHVERASWIIQERRRCSHKHKKITELPVPEPALVHLVAGLLAIGLALLSRRRG